MANKSEAGGVATKPDVLAQPGQEETGEKPDIIHVHNKHDGTFKTHHEPSGQEHDHENLEALKQHMDQFLNEEAGEPMEGGEEEPEYQ